MFGTSASSNVSKFSLHLRYDVIPAHSIELRNTWAAASQELKNSRRLAVHNERLYAESAEHEMENKDRLVKSLSFYNCFQDDS